MEKQIGFNSEELEQIFAQIKEKGDDHLSDKIYRAYEPLKASFMKMYHLKSEQVNDIYDDVFCFVYGNVLKEVIKPSDFDYSFKKIMDRQCSKLKQTKNTFNSELLGMSYAKHVTTSEMEERKNAEKQQFATQSLLFVIEILDELLQNHDLAVEHGLDEEKIDMIKDYYGLNKEHKKYSVSEIAEKHNVSETRARAMVVKGLKVLREMKEFQSIKTQLHNS